MTGVDADTATATTSHASPRLASIDILRGLSMTLMVFVNELAGVKGLPWWNYHMKANVDAMTYVDMVFPLFLFIVGLSMPLATASRLRRKPSLAALWMHVVLRTASLLTLGLILANVDAGDASRMLLSPSVWAILALIGAALFLNDYGASGDHGKFHRGLRISGLLLVVVMLALFRHVPEPGRSSWLDFSYPEILGLIGYTYFAVATLYIATRRWRWAPAVLFVGMMALNVGSAAGWLRFPQKLPYYVWPLGNGSFAAIVLAGVVTSLIFVGSHRSWTLRRKITLGMSFGVVSIFTGWMLVPLGISKIRATPTWSLFSVGAAILIFTGIYWTCDVQKRTSWALPFRPAGSNTLTTYLLPDLWSYVLAAAGIHFFETHFTYGWVGAVRCVVFTAFILALSGHLTQWRVRLRL